MAGLWIKDRFPERSEAPRPEPTATPSATIQPTATPIPQSTPGPEPTPTTFRTLPDPASGMIAFPAEREGDPPTFQMLINEVTCRQYQEFLQETLEEPPLGWRAGGRYPPGSAQLPVTNLTWSDAMAYCRWIAAKRGWDREAVRLPSLQEYRRALRYRTTRDRVDIPTYWARARSQLGNGRGPSPVKQTQFDKIFIPERGQMYDLVGNVAEWGWDQRDSLRVILGGDYTQTDSGFNHLEPRWRPPDQTSPTVGFRFVYLPRSRPRWP
jgi:formylglycine-generating enzyme required for sulfatase activity